MKCPHCQKEFHQNISHVNLGRAGKIDSFDCEWGVTKIVCPACLRPIIYISYDLKQGVVTMAETAFMVFPKGASRPQSPTEVPDDIAKDYNEACLVFEDSPQASAALSRRCLQHMLFERGVSKNENLSKAIDEALATNPPSHIAENLDAIRNIGLFAAHPKKSISSGEILPVEPHEAEWNLEVLEMLFDFYYVQPAKNAARRAALDKKLAEVGKPPMK